MTKKRRTVILEWSKFYRCWKLSWSKRNFTAIGGDRRDAVSEAAWILREDWKNFGTPSELLIRNKRTGEFSKDRRTFGADPERTKG